MGLLLTITSTVNNRKNTAIKLVGAISILILIGILRTIAEVKLGIFLDEKWFSYDKDILFAMACYPIYLCFFTFMCLHIICKLFQIKNSGSKIIIFLFFIQFMHLLIPPLDYIGFKYGMFYNTAPYLNSQGMSYGFSLNPFSGLKNNYLFPVYFTPLILLFTRVTTFGINLTWILVGIAFFIFLRKALNTTIKNSVFIILILFQLLYWPIYKYYFVFDGLFNKVAGIHYYNQYGYGMYFLDFGTIGLIYFLAVFKKKSF